MCEKRQGIKRQKKKEKEKRGGACFYLRDPHRRDDHDPLDPGFHRGVDLPLLAQPVDLDRRALVVSSLPGERRPRSGSALPLEDLGERDPHQRPLLDLGHRRRRDDDGVGAGKCRGQRLLGVLRGDVDGRRGCPFRREALEGPLGPRDGDGVKGLGSRQEVLDGELARAPSGARDADLCLVRSGSRSHDCDAGGAAAAERAPLADPLALLVGHKGGDRGGGSAEAARGRRGDGEGGGGREGPARAGAEGGGSGENLGAGGCQGG